MRGRFKRKLTVIQKFVESNTTKQEVAKDETEQIISINQKLSNLRQLKENIEELFEDFFIKSVHRRKE